jgi:hypothetical protein
MPHPGAPPIPTRPPPPGAQQAPRHQAQAGALWHLPAVQAGLQGEPATQSRREHREYVNVSWDGGGIDLDKLVARQASHSARACKS